MSDTVSNPSSVLLPEALARVQRAIGGFRGTRARVYPRFGIAVLAPEAAIYPQCGRPAPRIRVSRAQDHAATPALMAEGSYVAKRPTQNRQTLQVNMPRTGGPDGMTYYVTPHCRTIAEDRACVYLMPGVLPGGGVGTDLRRVLDSFAPQVVPQPGADARRVTRALATAALRCGSKNPTVARWADQDTCDLQADLSYLRRACGEVLQSFFAGGDGPSVIIVDSDVTITSPVLNPIEMVHWLHLLATGTPLPHIAAGSIAAGGLASIASFFESRMPLALTRRTALPPSVSGPANHT